VKRFVSALAVVALTAATSFAAMRPIPASDPALTSFSRWLEANRPGYGCDEGPAPFRNKTVEGAYPGQRFYYVLTYARGIRPPFENSVSLVAAVDDSGHVVPFLPGAPASYSRGLKRIKSSKDAKLAGAAVMIVASCGERHWPIEPERVKVKKSSKGWTATYFYDPYNSSWVSFDKKGAVLAFGGSSPPVP
jgi:hypothetical protein